MTKQLTALLLLLATFSIAHAETFTVTSNADSGPGSLREAIEKAATNGTVETDYIYFNIADVSRTGRTIVLKTELADLTSHLMIDASTQAGAKIGVSDARIRITVAANVSLRYVFRCMSVKNIGIYAIHFHDLRHSNTALFGTSAIAVHNVEALEVGAATKGNYFTKPSNAINNQNTDGGVGEGWVKGLSFKANIVNLTEDGTALADWFGSAIGLPLASDVTIGGPDPGEGNYFAGNDEYCITFQMDGYTDFDAGYFKIINNYFGCDFTKTKALNCGQVYIENLKSYVAVEKGDISIIGNLFKKYPPGMSFDLYPCFVVQNIDGFVDVRGNRIYANGAASLGFAIAGCGDGRIGGDGPDDPNIVSYCSFTGIAVYNNKAITISKNSLYCNSPGLRVTNDKYEVPHTRIFTLTDHLVKGTTLPNSKVEVFLTKTCGGCENGETYLGTTAADAAGNWSFTTSVLLDGPVTATGTSPQGVTGEFAHPEINSDQLEFDNEVACGKSTGYIKGLKIESATRSYWLMPPSGVDTLFNQLDLDHLGVGSYQLRAEQGPYCYVQKGVTIGDYSPRIYTTSARVMPPSCNKNNGGIGNVYTYGYYDKLFWHDTAGTVVGTELTLADVGPGRYKLVVLNKEGCGDSTDYFTLANQSGPSITTSAIKITDAKCGTATGSIQNIKISNITGMATYEWLDAADQTVGRTLDLKNIAGGTYHMILRDDSHCDISTKPIIVGSSSKTTIDASNVIITPSQCRYGSGSITGINITGTTDYEWTNEKGIVVSQDKNPTALLPGTYTLTAGKATGCPKTGKPITVPVEADMRFDPALQTTVTPTTCSNQNGSATLQNFPTPALYNFSWKQTAGTATIATTLNLKNTAAGSYTLFATDAQGCTERVITLSISAITPPQLQTAAVRLQNDLCTEHKGSIENLSVQNGTAPFTYQWVNAQEQPVANTINLQNTGTGTFQLFVKDANGCTVQSAPFTITDETKAFRTPQYANQLIPRNTSTTLTPQNSETGTYEWFSDATLTQRLGTNNNGIFTTPNLPADETFFIRLHEGACASSAAAVTVKVADDAKVYVPTGFTPNGDGKNDDLKPLVTGIFRLEQFVIYDRWGNVVFKSNDLSKGWNGHIKGLEAPIGVYVWLLNGTDFKGNAIQQKGSFTLIR